MLPMLRMLWHQEGHGLPRVRYPPVARCRTFNESHHLKRD